MPGRPGTGEAVRLLERELRIAGRETGDLDAEDVWRAFLRFGQLRFTTAGTPDADGLLVQYGICAFDGPATFTLDFARQFEAVDSDGNHEHYVQVHCELRYQPVPALHALGNWSSWYFHDTEESLDRWAQAVRNQPTWAATDTLTPTEIKVYQEQV
ncbi:hypothetical protein [Streptomyces melanogenes]|uniref:hypothetical protein n=1 Tax=Streptomyces melanogenes TaxID=67326 RepID=UPI0037B116AE